MEPRIRYVKSVDGTSIAVSTLGQGRPLVIVPTTRLATIEMYFTPGLRVGVERLAERRLAVLYDNRGYGFSERNSTDFSFKARVGDLAAVLDSLEAPVIDLLALTLAGPTAISYAAEHPARVGRLCLIDAVARGQDLIRTPRQRALRHLIDIDWELYVQTQFLVTLGWTDAARSAANSVIGAVAADVFIRATRAAMKDDVRELLPSVQCATLVAHQRDEPSVSDQTARQLTAAIPNARLTVVEQGSAWFLASETGIRILEEFLDEDSAVPAKESVLPSGTTIILFADIADSTALTEHLGDKAFRAKARDLDASLRAIIREHFGTCIDAKTLGDGVLATFSSAAQAIEATLACGRAGDDAGLPLHLGLHAGDVIREEGNVYGGAVNIAARISGLSAPGEVLVSDTLRGLARTSAGVSFEDRGEQSLKGVSEPLRVWAVRESS
jgi:class 3 adenylate cyclase